MAYEWLEEYCLAKKGVVKDWKEEWQVYRYLIGGKMFLMDGTNKQGQPIITLRLDPLRGDTLRQQYPETVVPGYYMNKTHWNSVYRENDFPDAELKSMIDESYALILAGLTKKAQKEILEAK